MSIVVGEVVAVSGVRITLRIFEESSKEVLFYRGVAFKGVSIRGYLSIQRGFRNIVCIVEGEFLDEGAPKLTAFTWTSFGELRQGH